MALRHQRRRDLAGVPVRYVIATRGKELAADDTVADARRLFSREAVRVLPVLDGRRYAGVVDREAIRGAPAKARVRELASFSVPTALGSAPSEEALAAADRVGATRLVVLDADGSYLGLVCMRGDRQRLCVDLDALAEHRPKGRSMTAIRPDAQVADLVLEQPTRARVFERYGIDYCCGGKVPLAEACAERGVDVAAVVAELEQAPPSAGGEPDWTAAPVSELCGHIVARHHDFLREELPRLQALTHHVAERHGPQHPELAEVAATLDATAEELTEHMAKEEHVLFPACAELEQGGPGGFAFGSLGNPISAMLHEHDDVAARLARIRELTGGYRHPEGACNSYRSMLDRLRDLEEDTHLHVHKENNILFPRVLAAESKLPAAS